MNNQVRLLFKKKMSEYYTSMELQNLIHQKEISEKSKIVYLHVLNSILKTGFSIPMSKNEKIEVVKEFVNGLTSTNKKLQYLNIMVILRTAKELPIEEIKKFRTDLQKEQKATQPAKMKEKGADLTSYENFMEKLDLVFMNKNYKKYIVNYLMVNFGVRNLDLDLEIVLRKKDISDNKNYLLIKNKTKTKPGSVTYIRDVYKTRSAYGKQTHVIDDEKFVAAVKGLGPSMLIQEDLLSNGIRKMYIDQNTEGMIFKMMISHYFKLGDSESIARLAASRGTSLDTVKGFYNVNASPPDAIELAGLNASI